MARPRFTCCRCLRVPGVLLAAILMAALSAGSAPAATAAAPAQGEGEVRDTGEARLPETLDLALQPWTGDFEAMLKRGLIRVAIPVGLSTYYLDGATQHGMTYDLVRAFRKHLHKTLGRRARNLTVAVLPARLDQVFPMVRDGRADIAAGRLTVTQARKAEVAFSLPFRSDIEELVVSTPGSKAIDSLDGLVGVSIHVKKSSSFWGTLERINAHRRAAGKAELTVTAADERLRTEDLLELVGAGTLQATVADSPVADLFARVFPKAVVQRAVPLAKGESYAWAFRKGDTKLARAVDGFARTARKGSRLGNILISRYFGHSGWIGNALAPAGKAKFERMSGLFQEMAGRYDFDWLMVIAQGYQESRLDQSKRSAAGAVGVMQLLPATARSPAVGIPDIAKLDKNVHAGTKYLHYLRATYLDEAAIDEPARTYFSFAAYNAGPGNLAKARRRAKRLGLDPDLWFDNVEIAMAQAVSRQPVVYVRNILKYYTAYKLNETETAARKAALGDSGDAPAAGETRTAD
ncbi:MAG: transporter substrate-binding domain-containing protein [Sneathiellaceae bacterium]